VLKLTHFMARRTIPAAIFLRFVLTEKVLYKGHRKRESTIARFPKEQLGVTDHILLYLTDQMILELRLTDNILELHGLNLSHFLELFLEQRSHNNKCCIFSVK